MPRTRPQVHCPKGRGYTQHARASPRRYGRRVQRKQAPGSGGERCPRWRPAGSKEEGGAFKVKVPRRVNARYGRPAVKAAYQYCSGNIYQRTVRPMLGVYHNQRGTNGTNAGNEPSTGCLPVEKNVQMVCPNAARSRRMHPANGVHAKCGVSVVVELPGEKVE